MKYDRITNVRMDAAMQKDLDALAMALKEKKAVLLRSAIREYLWKYKGRIKVGKNMMALRDSSSDTA